MKRLLPLLALCIVFCLTAVSCGTSIPAIEPAGIPWPDQEATGYVVQDALGTQTGAFYTSILRQGDAYVMTSYAMVGNATDEIVLTMDAVDLKPISEKRAVYAPPGGAIPEGSYEVRADFVDNQVTVEVDLPDDEHQGPVTLAIPADSYCNDQVWYLFRALPREEGYTGTYTNVILWTSYQTASAQLEVAGNETVETLAGTFDCYRIDLSIDEVEIHFWYAVEAPHYMVKYQKGNVILLLAELIQ